MLLDIAKLYYREGVRGIGLRVYRELIATGIVESTHDAQPVAYPRLDTTHPFQVVRHPFYNPTAGELELNRTVTARFLARPSEIRSATWFLPAFRHPLFGGVFTILMCMEWMTREHGVRHRVVFYDNKDVTDEEMRNRISDQFPVLADIDIVIPRHDPPYVDFSELPYTDIGVCTLWYSAYALLRFNNVGAKFYFVQDFEPNFYPAGTLFGLCEATYRFGFAGIVNSTGLESSFTAYGNPAVAFTPSVRRLSEDLTNVDRDRSARTRVVIYGRPDTDRNAFELLVESAKTIKQRLGDEVEIISVGGEWSETSYGLEGIVTNLGLLDNLDEVHSQYEAADIGICFQFARHPSYQPLEYFATGTAVIANRNLYTDWLLRDGENCLLIEPFPNEVADAVVCLHNDPDFKAKLVSAGFNDIQSTKWDKEFEKVWSFLTGLQGHGR